VVRVHRPKEVDGALPCIFSIHGGGYIVGSYDMDDPKFDRQCVHFPCVGVSVEYRLAPETAYPGPLDDCYAGLRWTYEHADELGIAPDRIGIAGVSAGGGLAAALALLARDRGEVPVAFQLLECPMLYDRDGLYGVPGGADLEMMIDGMHHLGVKSVALLTQVAIREGIVPPST